MSNKIMTWCGSVMTFAFDGINDISKAGKKRFIACVLVAGLIAIVMANSSYAAIRVGSIDFGFTGISFAAGTNQYNANPLDLDGDTNSDINFTIYHGGVGTPNNDLFAIQNLNSAMLFTSHSGYTGDATIPVRSFNIGDLITGAAPTSYLASSMPFGSTLTTDGSGINTFNATEKYLGLRTSAGHLGWLEVQITPVGDELGVNIIDYGFDDSGVSIPAGAGASSSEPNINISTTLYDFGNVSVGTTSTPNTFTVSNTGNADLTIKTITLTGSDASEFAIQNDYCSAQIIPPSGNCTIDAVFAPTSLGAKSANLSIPSDDPDTPILTVPLSGIGIVNIGTISGFVTDSSHNPAQNVRVLFWKNGVKTEVKTDVNGWYIFTGLADGKYNIVARMNSGPKTKAKAKIKQSKLWGLNEYINLILP